MGPREQQELLSKVANAAREEGCLVAPVGSVYFVIQGRPRPTTKDLDAVVFDADREPASLAALKRIAERLGTAEVMKDEAVVRVAGTTGRAEVELIRGREASKGGFFPRALLREAAQAARKEGNVLIFPLEYVLVLKADAAVDREDRAKRDTKRAAEHERRANAFRTDVFAEVNRATLDASLDTARLKRALAHLKEKRRERVRGLFVAAGATI